MSSPSPEPPPSTPEHVYQPAESLSDHNTNTTTSTIPAGGHQSPVTTGSQQQVSEQQQVVHSCQCLEQREKTSGTILNNGEVIKGGGECLSSSQQHHNVINLIAHMPPSGGGAGVTPTHIHPNNQVHVHVHASPKSIHHHATPTTTPTSPPHSTKHSDSLNTSSATNNPIRTSPIITSCTCHHHHYHHHHDNNSSGGGGGGISRDPRAIVSGGGEDLNILGHHDGRKLDADDRIEVSPLPPALPPRPPPRPRGYGEHGPLAGLSGTGGRLRSLDASNNGRGIRKYVFWCCVCGGLSAILGLLFMIVYFIVRTYTSTLAYFETIPTIVPAVMLILTGICVISLARRKNRYSYLIKVCGLCCLVCAVTCVLVTITTTVIHMSRLQTLRECVYTSKTRTCTCYSVLLEAHASTDEGMRFVFDSTPDCEVIHGVLYSCLRAMFGLSVSGILICIFSCMLVYQLLSHERKKMYWEQLELRCRSFYQQHTVAPTVGTVSAPGSMRSPPMPPPTTYCSCCDECVYPSVVPPIAVPPQVYPWEPHPSAERFWTPGRVGNFYSPNPGEEITGSTEGRDRANSGWSWRRLAWNRSNTNQSSNIDNNRDASVTLYHHLTAPTSIPQHTASTSASDSQYGFTIAPPTSRSSTAQPHSTTGSYSMLSSDQQQQQRSAQPPPPPPPGVYVWGPPPPYSDPNSPARRSAAIGYHQHQHHGGGGMGWGHHVVGGVSAMGHHHPHGGMSHHAHHQLNPLPAHHHITHHDSHCQLNDDLTRTHDQQQQQRRLMNLNNSQRGINNKDNYENAVDHDVAINDNSESTTDTSSYSVNSRISSSHHTLPARKMKKRATVVGTEGGGAQQQQQQGASVKSQSQHHRVNVKTIFKQHAQPQIDSDQKPSNDMPEYHEPDEVKSNTDCNTSTSSNASSGADQCRYLPRLQGVENAAFQNQESSNSPQKTTIAMTVAANVSGQEPSESEVYFADVSSCCNISVRNDSVLYDEALLETQKPRLTSLQKAVTEAKNSQLLQTFQENICNNTVTEDEEYLAHRLGQRQQSTRSRLPFPLPLGDTSANMGVLGDISTEPCLQLCKDMSQNSLCSNNTVQTPMTESTDCDTANTLSPSSPSNNDFVRRNLNDFLAPDAQYEMIQESESQGPNLTNTISELNNSFNQGNYFQTKKTVSGEYNPQKMSPSKGLNFNQTPSGRRIGTNISSLIHNLSGSSSGLLYGDDHSGGEDELHEDKKKSKEAQSQSSDCTMDSGWQSGSDKAERKDTTKNSIT